MATQVLNNTPRHARKFTSDQRHVVSSGLTLERGVEWNFTESGTTLHVTGHRVPNNHANPTAGLCTTKRTTQCCIKDL